MNTKVVEAFISRFANAVCFPVMEDAESSAGMQMPGSSTALSKPGSDIHAKSSPGLTSIGPVQGFQTHGERQQP